MSKCLLTGTHVENFDRDNYGYYLYDVKKDMYIYHFKIEQSEFNLELYKDFYKKYELEINWMLLNNSWLENDQPISLKNLEALIFQTHFPNSPKEKLDSLFNYIFRLQNYEGEIIESFYYDDTNNLWQKFFMRNSEELEFYFKYLFKQEFLKGVRNRITITFEGLEYIIKLNEEGRLSKNCFIAMSFNDTEKPIYTEGILPALIETGYEPIIVNALHIDSDKTINDEIIASIKKSKFIIADFTAQKNGVYFEAGYALGRGLKVIYTCKRPDFDKTHFDTNHFSHILYNDTSELKTALINKIEAFIND